MDKVSTTTAYAVRKIASNLQLSPDTVKTVIDSYISEIFACLKVELPFCITGFGKFFYRYRTNERMGLVAKDPTIYIGKVHKELNFRVSPSVKSKVNAWVHDLGIKNNASKKDLTRLKIMPEEIAKMRRSRILEEQRAVGFRSDLLFDDDKLPHHDRMVMKELGEAPSISDVVAKLGVNIKDRS